MRTRRLDLVEVVAKAARLGRASRGHILRIEIEHDIAARGQFFEGDLVAVRIRQVQRWSLLTLQRMPLGGGLFRSGFDRFRGLRALRHHGLRRMKLKPILEWRPVGSNLSGFGLLKDPSEAIKLDASQ